MKYQNKIRHKGQGQVEYALLIALIALVTITTLVLLGPQIGDVFSRVLNWSTAEESAEENPGHIVVRVVAADGTGIENVRVYAFNAAGRYLGKYGNTDANGELSFEEMDEGSYKFRANYQRKQFWSPVINWQGEWLAVIETGQRPFTVNVVDAAQAGVTGVRVYAFTAEDRYIGLYGNSDSNGEVVFDLSDGSYKFRANFRKQQYWSDVAETPATSSAMIETGQRPFTVHVIDAQNEGIENVRVYAFAEDGKYIGVYGNTNSGGAVALDIPDGAYKFRANYRRNEYWSDAVQTPGQDTAVIQTNQSTINVLVTNSQGDGLNNVRVYAFNPNGNYVGVYDNTDSQGQAALNLPQGAYKFRANYRSGTYWSGVVNTSNNKTATIQIQDGTVDVRIVDGSGQPQKNINVHVFTAAGHYIGVRGKTDANGFVNVTAPPGPHKIRADYKGAAYWSAVFDVAMQTAVTITTE